MLPSQGACIAVFLLGRSAFLKPRRTVEEWIDGTRSSSSFMAASLDLQKPAETMISSQLVSFAGEVKLSDNLSPFVQIADRSSLYAIARLLLLDSPPLWLHLAVGQEVRREYIPSWDLEELSWLEPDLDSLLLEIASRADDQDQDDIRKQLGDAAELLLLQSLKAQGKNPLHVAAISDAFGYDIECRKGQIDRIEVKASSENTRGRFLLTRNEYQKSLVYGSQWRLVQVVFHNIAFVQRTFNSAHIVGVFQLKHGALQKVVPADTECFRWIDSAEVSIPPSGWVQIAV